jgi:hypothetical protein
MESKFVRLDGKQLTQKQREELMKKELEKIEGAKKEEDFDPRKHRLKHGIRNYNKVEKSSTFVGMKGIKLN